MKLNCFIPILFVCNYNISISQNLNLSETIQYINKKCKIYSTNNNYIEVKEKALLIHGREKGNNKPYVHKLDLPHLKIYYNHTLLGFAREDDFSVYFEYQKNYQYTGSAICIGYISEEEAKKATKAFQHLQKLIISSKEAIEPFTPN